ncbi:MAG: cyclase family protein [Saprospiraceae bacterium]
MMIQIQHHGKSYQADLTKTIDISIPLEAGTETVNCFYAPPMTVSPVVAGDFIGATQQGGPVNFMNVALNPHGNGTHTECVGHIAKEKYTINQSLRTFHFVAKLISITPVTLSNGDQVIQKAQLENLLHKAEVRALIIRTLPNHSAKMRTNYSGENPTYLTEDAMDYVVSCGIEHFLIDLPSVDRAEDEGKLLAHHSFWQYPDAVRTTATISELIYVPDSIRDDLYLLNLQIASFEIDVSPSKPVLYALTTI